MHPLPRYSLGIVVVTFGVLVWLVPSTGHAQGTDATETPTAPSDAAHPEDVVPPELIEPVDPGYPSEALEQRLEGRVLLSLTVDREGRVTEIEVTQPAGHGFDEAARDAALRMRFRPARWGGRPVAAKIRRSFVFTPPPETPPEQVAPPTPAAPATATGVPPPSPSAQQPAGTDVSPPDDSTEVVVQGTRSEAERIQQSAEAVTVVETRKAKQRSSDLGEVLARTQGVGVRRSGGLGSIARFSLNGLYDDQVRFFLDGVPLEVAGYPFEIVNVPVNLVDYVHVYRGVVPVRFGADALGGAVNLVTDQTYRRRLTASYQVGSFGTHRATLEGRYRHERTNAVVGLSSYFDAAQNNYEVDVEVPDERGRLHPATVPRFHDDYTSYGGSVEAGVVDEPWARRLLLKGFAATYDKEHQHNLVMTVPYGEVRYGESVYGGTLRYDVNPARQFEIEVVGSYARRIIDYVDRAKWVYTWFGERIRERRVPGEVEARGHDQRYWQNGWFGRVLFEWNEKPISLRLSLSPAYTTRTGDERLQADPDARDPLSAERKLFTFVSGIEHVTNLFRDRLENIVFVKEYRYAAHTEEPLPGEIFRERDKESRTFGVGDSLRYRFATWGYAKASYEYATRLPRPDEVFGDGMFVLANLGLEPEVSHNANLGPRVELKETPAGEFMVDVNLFLRDSDQLIVLLGNDRFFTYQNVYSARSQGVEGAASWVSPRRTVNLDGSMTWLDTRNTSTDGTFEDFEGDRIPNRPYLFASWGGRLRFDNLPGPNDAVEPFYEGRYVHEFFRGWESVGLVQFKQVIESQLTHNVGVTWIVSHPIARITSTFEVENVTDEKVYDYFGAQRPGRAFYLKMTGEIR